MKRICVWFVLLTAASGFAQSFRTCDVTMWANEAYSHSSPKYIFYFVRVGRLNYEIVRPGPDVEMNSGQRISCRVNNGYMFIRDSQGRVRKAQIIETGQPIRNQ